MYNKSVILAIAAVIAFLLAGVWTGFALMPMLIVGGGLLLLIIGGGSLLFKAGKARSNGIMALLGVIILGVWFYMPGAITSFGLPSAALTSPISTAVVQQQVSSCAAGVSAEQRSQMVTATVNSYDLDAAAGQGTAVDQTTACFYYRNGNKGTNFVSLSSDTADGSVTTVWTPGDTVYGYCGGSSYYTEPIEGQCVDTRGVNLVLNAHAAATAAQLEVGAFDKNFNALTAAGNTTTADFDLTIGASTTDYLTAEWYVDTANKAANVQYVATTTYNDIKDFFPVSAVFSHDGVDTPVAIAGIVPTADYLRNVKLSNDDAASTGNITATYTVYKLASPILLNARGDTLKVKFQVNSGATDPTATDNVFSTQDMAVGCLFDAQYIKNPQTGDISLNYYNEAIIGSQTDAGVANLPAMPAGADDCFVVSGA